MKFRLARHTNSLAPLIEFYTKNLELEVLGEFKSHDDYDGTFLGKKGMDWHLEFTASKEKATHQADEDDLMVFYVDNEVEFNRIKVNFDKNGIKLVEPKNPYWKKNALTYKDPDGFNLVISLRKK